LFLLINGSCASLRRRQRVLVPSIVYSEIRRELLRAREWLGLASLDTFMQSDPRRYLQLTDGALRLAAELWAKALRHGRPDDICVRSGH
jgi:predicted nucleic acid-binding protein